MTIDGQPIFFMKKLKLNKGYTLVDDEDYQFLKRFNWTRSVLDERPRATRMILVKNRKIEIPIEYFIVSNKTGCSYFHKNKNTLDNRKENIVFVRRNVLTHISNKSKMYAGRPTSSKYKGVYFDKRDLRFDVRIYYEGKKFYLGKFMKEKDAAKAYNKKALELYGDLAYQNKI